MVDLQDKVVTGDALYCQTNICRQVVDKGGDYLITVKQNQPELYEDIALVFERPPVGEVFSYTQSVSKHGDRIELRRLWATGALNGYLDWPYAAQVCKVEREVESKGEVRCQVRYAVSSLGQEVGAAELLGYVRGHWGIENKLHYVRDVTFGEDGSQVRSGSAPQVMAALRNVVVNILRLNGATAIAPTLRQIGWQPGHALRLLGLPST